MMLLFPSMISKSFVPNPQTPVTLKAGPRQWKTHGFTIPLDRLGSSWLVSMCGQRYLYFHRKESDGVTFTDLSKGQDADLEELSIASMCTALTASTVGACHTELRYINWVELVGVWCWHWANTRKAVWAWNPREKCCTECLLAISCDSFWTTLILVGWMAPCSMMQLWWYVVPWSKGISYREALGTDSSVQCPSW